MAFWTQAMDSTQADPKRKFRFTVHFNNIDDGDGNGGVLWYAKTCSKPAFSLSATEHKYLNHTFYYPGSVTWQDVTLSLVDPVNPDMTVTVAQILEQSGYVIPGGTTTAGLATISKGQAVGALGQITIQQFNGQGEVIETWTLWNAFITEAKFGDLEYGSDELVQLDLTLKYDWASLDTSNGGKSALNSAAGAQSAFNLS